MDRRKALLFLIVLLALSFFWNFQFFTTPGSFGIFDWRKDIFLLEIHFQAIRDHAQIPLGIFFIPEGINSYPTLGITSSLIANPEVLKLSPASLLVYFFEDAVDWFRLLVFLHYIPGVLGVLLLSSRSNFSWAGVIVLYCLTLLNPWLLQHLAIGYLPWVNLGWAALAVGIVVRGPRSPLHMIFSGAAAAMILWQGGLHLFVWLEFGFCAFIALYIIFAPGRASVSTLAHYPLHVLSVVLLSLPFLWGGAVAFQGYAVVPQAGIGSFTDLYNILTDTASPLYDLPAAYNRHGTNIYDGSLVMGRWFVAIFLAAALVEIGLWISGRDRDPVRAATLACVAAFVIPSFGFIWRWLAEFIPLLGSEKYPWRFLFIALLFAIYFLVNLGEYLTRKWSPPRYRAIVILLIFLPVLHATYERNRFFNRVATASPAPGAIQTENIPYREQISDVLRSIRNSDPTGAGNVNTMVFVADREETPCLHAPPGWQVAPTGDFLIEGGRWHPQEKNCFLYHPGSKRIALTFRDFSFQNWYLLLLITIPLGLVIVSTRRLRQGKSIRMKSE